MTQLFQCDVCQKTFNTAEEALKCEKEHAEEACDDITHLIRHLNTICEAKPLLNVLVKKKDSADRKCLSFEVETVEVKTLCDSYDSSMTPYIKIFAKENKEGN